MNYFEELTGKNYYFTTNNSFYWDNLLKIPYFTKKDLNSKYLNSSVVTTQYKQIDDNYTISDFLNEYNDNYIVFHLNNNSIYHYLNEDDYYDYPISKNKKYIKVFIDYKN